MLFFFFSFSPPNLSNAIFVEPPEQMERIPSWHADSAARSPRGETDEDGLDEVFGSSSSLPHGCSHLQCETCWETSTRV